jgi:hypothetical protein
MDMVSFEPFGLSASPEQRRVVLAPVPGVGQDDRPVGTPKPAYRIAGMSAVDDRADEAGDRDDETDPDDDADEWAARHHGPDAVREGVDQCLGEVRRVTR